MRDWLTRWRKARTLERRAIPDALWALTLARFHFLTWREADDIAALREMTTLFLADKEFTGAHGLEVDDEMAVAIAAQACLPVLRLGLHWLDGFKGIVVHADAVVAQREHVDEAGVVHHYEEELTGEAMHGGAKILTTQHIQCELGVITHPIINTYCIGHPIDLLIRPDDIQYNPNSPLKAKIVAKFFRGAYFLYSLELASKQTVLSLIPSYHNHNINEYIGIELTINHIITFAAK